MKLRPIYLLILLGATLMLCAGQVEPESQTVQTTSSVELVFQCSDPIEIIGEIPVPPPGSVVTVTTFANAINGVGQVVGYWSEEIDDNITIDVSNKAYVSENGNDFTFIGNDNSQARGIDGSVVVGFLKGSNSLLAFYYSLNSQGDPVYINDDRVAAYIANDIFNDKGEINLIGYSIDFSNAIQKAYIYNSNDGSIALDTPFISDAKAINNKKIIVGNYSTEEHSNFPHAFAYNRERTPSLIDLGNLSAYAPYKSFAFDINDQNIVVGATEISDTNELRAFWFDTDAPLYSAQMEVMDCITGTTGTFCPVEALAINNTDFIVGSGSYSPEPQSGDEAFLYDKNNDALFNLNDLIDDASWHLEEATDINDSGWIVGNGTRNGQGRAFKLHCGYTVNGATDAVYLPVVLRDYAPVAGVE